MVPQVEHAWSYAPSSLPQPHLVGSSIQNPHATVSVAPQQPYIALPMQQQYFGTPTQHLYVAAASTQQQRYVSFKNRSNQKQSKNYII